MIQQCVCVCVSSRSWPAPSFARQFSPRERKRLDNFSDQCRLKHHRVPDKCIVCQTIRIFVFVHQTIRTCFTNLCVLRCFVVVSICIQNRLFCAPTDNSDFFVFEADKTDNAICFFDFGNCLPDDLLHISGPPLRKTHICLHYDRLCEISTPRLQLLWRWAIMQQWLHMLLLGINEPCSGSAKAPRVLRVAPRSHRRSHDPRRWHSWWPPTT